MKSQEEETGINCQNDQELAGTKRNPPPHLERGWETEREAAPRGDRRPRPPSIPQAEAGAASTRSRSPPLARGVAGVAGLAGRIAGAAAATRPDRGRPDPLRVRASREEGLPYAPAARAVLNKQRGPQEVKRWRSADSRRAHTSVRTGRCHGTDRWGHV